MSRPVQVPADVEREDVLIGRLTARQVAVVAVTAVTVYGLWTALGPENLLWFVVAATPVGLLGAAFTIGRRDGLSLDRLLLAALRQRAGLRSPPTRPSVRPRLSRTPDAGGRAQDGSGATSPDAAAEGGGRGGGRVVGVDPVLRGVRAAGADRLGIVDLGARGSAVVCSVSPINLSLRSGAEQDAVVSGFARWLHSLTAPVQILTRTRPLDLSGSVNRLEHTATRLEHPALARAALAHAAHLRAIAARSELVDHEFLIVFRDPAPSPAPTSGSAAVGGRSRTAAAAVEALRRRAGDASLLLGPLGLRVCPLSGDAAAAVLRRASAPATTLRPHDPAPPPRPRPPRPSAAPSPAHRSRWEGGRPGHQHEDRGAGSSRWDEAPTVELPVAAPWGAEPSDPRLAWREPARDDPARDDIDEMDDLDHDDLDGQASPWGSDRVIGGDRR